jgi:hypothetical protein
MEGVAVIHTIPESIHALLSPSKAHQWLACTGSLAATKGIPNKASRYAAEGTVYHDVARRALTEDKDCAAYVGDRYQVGEFEFTVDADNAEEAQKYVDRVRAIPGKRYVEVDLEYSQLLGVPREHGGSATCAGIPVAAGTGDAVVLDYEHSMVWSVDLKFGRGDIVYAKENPQLRLYGAAAVERFAILGIDDSWRITMAIDQPRVNHYDSETITVGELRAWVAAQRLAANRAYTLWASPHLFSESDLTPGEKQCRWCPLSGNCPAQADKILSMFPKGHAAEAVPKLTQIDDVDLATSLDLADEIEHWLSAVRAEGLKRALEGRTLPNWKVVEGRRGNRNLDEDARVQLDVAALHEIGVEGDEPTALPVDDALHLALGDAAYKPRELLTVAKLQKPLEKKAPLLWAALQPHITQADGKPGLARIEDPRPPQPIATLEFPAVSETGKASLL